MTIISKVGLWFEKIKAITQLSSAQASASAVKTAIPQRWGNSSQYQLDCYWVKWCTVTDDQWKGHSGFTAEFENNPVKNKHTSSWWKNETRRLDVGWRIDGFLTWLNGEFFSSELIDSSCQSGWVTATSRTDHWPAVNLVTDGRPSLICVDLSRVEIICPCDDVITVGSFVRDWFI